jgi:predicted nucleic acid-binding protein
MAVVEARIVMDYMEKSAEIYSCAPLPRPLPDPDDAPFLEVALAASADCLVTGNRKHFPARCRCGVEVLSPAQLVRFLRS